MRKMHGRIRRMFCQRVCGVKPKSAYAKAVRAHRKSSWTLEQKKKLAEGNALIEKISREYKRKHRAVQALASAAFQDGYNLIAEPILVHPHSKSYPWPTWQGRCYPWQAETARPTIYTARWDGQNLRYYA